MVNGGLSAITPQSQEPEQAPVVSPFEQTMLEYKTKQKELIDHQRKLMERLESRISSPQDMFLALASGFGKVPVGGSFTESLGNAMSSVAGQQEKARAYETDLAKMRFELGKSELDLAKQNMLTQGVIGMMGGDQGGAAPSGGMAPAGGRAPGQLVPSNIRPILKTMAVLDPAGAMKYVMELAKDEAKTPDAIKAMNFYLNALPPEMRAQAIQYAATSNIFGKPEDKTQAILKIKEAIDSEQISPQEGERLISLLQPTAVAPLAPSQAPSGPRVPVAKMEGVPSQVMAEIESITDPAKREEVRQAYLRQLQGVEAQKPPMTKREREFEQTTRTEQAKEDIKRRTESEKGFFETADRAGNDIRTADMIYNTVKSNPNAFGLLAKPGWDKALGILIESGFGVGPYRVGIPQLQDAMRRAGNFSQADIDAVSKVEMAAIQLQLAISANKGQGSVSNYERELFAKAAVSMNDSPQVIQYKAELVRIAANRARELARAYSQFKKNGGNFDDFKYQSDDFSRINDKYDQALDRLREAYRQ